MAVANLMYRFGCLLRLFVRMESVLTDFNHRYCWCPTKYSSVKLWNENKLLGAQNCFIILRFFKFLYYEFSVEDHGRMRREGEERCFFTERVKLKPVKIRIAV